MTTSRPSRQTSFEAGLLPTPTVPNGGRGLPKGTTFSGNTALAPSGRKVQVELHHMVETPELAQLLPTPTTMDFRDGTVLRKDNNLAQGGRHGVGLNHLVEGGGYSQPAIPASHSATPASGAERMTPGTSGLTLLDSLPDFQQRNGRIGAFGRTFVGTSPWASTVCLMKWKASATPAKRTLFLLQVSGRSTKETGSGSSERLFMTPKAGDADFGTPTNPGRPREMSTHLGTQVVANPPDLRTLTKDGLFTTPTTDVTDRDAKYKQGGTPLAAQARAIGRMPFGTPTAGVGDKDAAPTEGMAHRYLVEGKGGNLLETVAGMMWPTPRAGKTTDESEESWRRRNETGSVSTPPLSLAVRMWATPRGEGHDAGHHPGRSDSLDAQVKDVVVGPLYPTPDASGEKFRLSGDSQQSRCLEAKARRGELDGLPQKLNPDFVERLMGFPDDWTKLDGEPKAALPDGYASPLDLFMVNREYEVPLTVGGKTPDRVNRLKALGNAVVPQIPFLIFSAIEAADRT